MELTAGCILADMRNNYHSDATISLVYQTGEGTLLNRTVDYNRLWGRARRQLLAGGSRRKS